MDNYTKKTYPTYKSESFLVKLFKVNGKLEAKIQAEKYYRYFLNTYGKEGMEGTFKVTLKKPKRTDLQNSFMWVYLNLISLSSGNTPQEIHNWAKGKFLTEKITQVFGDNVRKIGSTANLSRPEFVDYMLKIEEVTEIPIPDPEPFSLELSNEEYKRMKRSQESTYKKMESKNLN